ncbi:hypothetical protein HAX54_026069 [Datura stramonium]|uniref:Uncharacterized protein n=1 Tax=Datura stramonium TaxID=4076 RepID=A0ABS8S7M9_DATST|nr:hypothetical protein [Datura stramonium]
MRSETEMINQMAEISSFQSLCALLWRAVTRARKFPTSKMTTFRMAVNCRHRLQPNLNLLYFGNAIQSIPTYVSAGDVLCHDLHWCAEQLNKNVKAHDDDMVRKFVEDWEMEPRCFPLGNFDGAMLTMGSSPRFPMYDNDFGWGRPIAVRSGRANKFDGKISAFPGRKGGGSVDLEANILNQIQRGIKMVQVGGGSYFAHVTRARKFPASKITTFRMPVHCCHSFRSKLNPLYFDTAIRSIPTYTSSRDILPHDLLWCGEQLNKNVKAQDDVVVRKFSFWWRLWRRFTVIQNVVILKAHNFPTRVTPHANAMRKAIEMMKSQLLTV